MRWSMGQEFTLIVLFKTANTKPPSCPVMLWLNLLTPTRSPMIDPVSYLYIYSHGYHQPYKSYLVVIYGYRLPKHIYIYITYYIHQH